MRGRLLTLALVLPIPFVPSTPVYRGHPAVPAPIQGIAPVPQNRYMAPNPRSEIHDDAWQTDAYFGPGPLGRSPQTISSMLVPNRDCGSIAFDRAGRVISVCVGISGPELYQFDPGTLAPLATFNLPPRQEIADNIFQDFTGGGYFYLDNQGRVVTSTTTRHIYVIAETRGGFALQRDYDLSRVLSPTEKITSALPDAHGLLWFVARRDGVVGTLNFRTGAVHATRVGNGAVGEIENSFATDAVGGVYIATNRDLYRFGAGRDDSPRVSWRTAYPNSLQSKPGQVDDGTGTTPTVMAGGYVNITDNADPMDVVVYRTAVAPSRMIRRHGRQHRTALSRLVCRVPVFRRGASASENSIMVAGRSMIVENNFGYQNPKSITAGVLTAPGFARVDVDRNGRSCHLVWTNSTDGAPTVVSKLSIANGLIYTYTKGPGAVDPWYWTALSFRTGRMVFKQLAGTGSILYNNNYAGLAIGPRGTEYLGTLGGIIAMRDGR